jgi:uncharacterized phiE125 gp8 family phage protein
MYYWNTPKIETQPNSRVATAGAYTEITLATFKQHLKWDSADTSEDTIMQIYLTAAFKQAEMYTRRVISRATWRSYLSGFHNVTLDVNPVDTIVVKYYDVANSLTTLASTEYDIINNGPDAFQEIRFTWNTITQPEVYDREEAVFLEYSAGYTTIPEGLQVAILRQAADYFETRQNITQGGNSLIDFGFHPLLFPYRML